MRMDPTWLLETNKSADFTTAEAAATWNDPRALSSPHYVTACLYFRHFGKAVPNPPRCDQGGVGVALLSQLSGGASGSASGADTEMALCLSMGMHGSNTTQATAAWDFPSAETGTFLPLHTWVGVCECLWVYLVCRCMWLCSGGARVCVCMCVCVCGGGVGVHSLSLTFSCSLIHSLNHSLPRSQARTQTHTHIHTHTRARARTCSLSHILLLYPSCCLN